MGNHEAVGVSQNAGVLVVLVLIKVHGTVIVCQKYVILQQCQSSIMSYPNEMSGKYNRDADLTYNDVT